MRPRKIAELQPNPEKQLENLPTQKNRIWPNFKPRKVERAPMSKRLCVPPWVYGSILLTTVLCVSNTGPFRRRYLLEGTCNRGDVSIRKSWNRGCFKEGAFNRIITIFIFIMNCLYKIKKLLKSHISTKNRLRISYVLNTHSFYRTIFTV